MKRIIAGGLLGGVAMIVWLFVADGILGFRRSIDMKTLAGERVVYECLSDHVTEPGRYVINPEILPERRFPGDDPVFAVAYSGLGHDRAGEEMIAGLLVALLAPVAGAWLLGNASSRILARYGSRFLFFAAIGLTAVLLGIAARFGIGSYSLHDTLALATHDLSGWIIAGLVVAWRTGSAGERTAPGASAK